MCSAICQPTTTRIALGVELGRHSPATSGAVLSREDPLHIDSQVLLADLDRGHRPGPATLVLETGPRYTE